MRPVTTEADIEDRNTLVALDPDHPGFRDADYRARRNEIAQITPQAVRYQALPRQKKNIGFGKQFGLRWAQLNSVTHVRNISTVCGV